VGRLDTVEKVEGASDVLIMGLKEGKCDGMLLGDLGSCSDGRFVGLSEGEDDAS